MGLPLLSSDRLWQGLSCCFLSSSPEELPTYTKIWSEISKAVDYKPMTLLLDMEPASAEAFLSIFGQVIIVYCYFHWRFVNYFESHFIQFKQILISGRL